MIAGVAVVMLFALAVTVTVKFYLWWRQDTQFMEFRVESLTRELEFARADVRRLQAEVDGQAPAAAEDLDPERFAPPELPSVEGGSPEPAEEPWFTVEESSWNPRRRWFVFDDRETLIDLNAVHAVMYVEPGAGKSGDDDDETRIFSYGQKILSVHGNVTGEILNALIGRDQTGSDRSQANVGTGRDPVLVGADRKRLGILVRAVKSFLGRDGENQYQDDEKALVDALEQCDQWSDPPPEAQ